MSSSKSKGIPKAKQAPPMGPVLHWKVGVMNHPSKEEGIEWDNTVKMAQYIIERVAKLEKSKTAKLSKLELVDLKDFARWAVDEYEDPLMDELNKVIPIIDTLLQSKRVVDDSMKKEVYIGGIIVEKGRFANRRLLLGIYISTLKTTQRLLFAAKDKSYDTPLTEDMYKLRLQDRDYVEYLIDHHIFRKSDIKKALPTDIFKEFDKFKNAYQAMKKARK
jgi:hypothetical protein